MKQVVDLRPDRDLLDHDFSGYKLSLESVTIYDKGFDCAVDTVKPGDDQYSYAHVRIFSLHNHLHVNPHTPEMVYFIDDQWSIMQVKLSKELGRYGHPCYYNQQVSTTPMNRVESITRVGVIPRGRGRKPGDYPVSVLFASADRAVIADGAGTFHVAAVKKDKWVIIFSDTTLPDGSLLLSAVQDGNKLCILSRTVVEPKFDSVLQWLTLDEHWKTLSIKKIQVSGNLQHASIESPSSVIVITDGCKTPKFIPDSAASLPSETEFKYTWTQTEQDIQIVIDTKQANTDDVKVEITDQTLLVSIRLEEIVSGNFAHHVDEVTWNLEGGRLEIRAVKSEAGLGWREVIDGDSSGEQFQIAGAGPEDPSFNTEELEEVDVASPASLLRLDLNKADVSHQVDLSTQQFLFPVTTDPSKPPSICVRHLTDACVWNFETSEDSTWRQNHIGTFSAFGYVQASKTQRKFIVAPENLSYVTIADAFRHLYIFRQPSPVGGLLRNRTSGTRVSAVAKQQLVNLETNDEILGIRATNNLLLVLTIKQFFVLVINQSPL